MKNRDKSVVYQDDIIRMHKNACLGYRISIELETGIKEGIESVEFADRIHPTPLCPDCNEYQTEPVSESLVLTSKVRSYLLCTGCWSMYSYEESLGGWLD